VCRCAVQYRKVAYALLGRRSASENPKTRLRMSGVLTNGCFAGGVWHGTLRVAWRHQRDAIAMSFALFLRGLVGALLAFAVATYLITGSVWSTFVQTIICAVLVQVGYFACVLFLVWRSRAVQKGDAGTSKAEAAQGLAKDEKPAGEANRLPSVPRSGHP